MNEFYYCSQEFDLFQKHFFPNHSIKSTLELPLLLNILLDSQVQGQGHIQGQTQKVKGYVPMSFVIEIVCIITA